jgi:hypothetical protein
MPFLPQWDIRFGRYISFAVMCEPDSFQTLDGGRALNRVSRHLQNTYLMPPSGNIGI